MHICFFPYTLIKLSLAWEPCIHTYSEYQIHIHISDNLQTGSSFSLLQMLYCVLTYFVGAGAAFAAPSFLHPPLLFQLYISAVLLHCLIKLTCNWNISTQTAPGFPSSAFPSCYLHPVWLPVAARWGTLRARLQAHLRLNQWLSAVSYRLCVGEIVR